ncbi:DUF882 domain-containing protein [Aquibium carbonis]|uniref:Murein endopeptidase K n=1 Tax=Aquibium carbonis TaxID=2495581 RepID=A0A3S0A7K2_9HYPH|nr:DUF882 domain-containing protein [Aquibium carbonis]
MLAGIIVASCSATGDSALKIGPSGFASGLTSVLSQAEAELSAEAGSPPASPDPARRQSDASSASTNGGDDGGQPATVGLVPAADPQAPAAPPIALAAPDKPASAAPPQSTDQALDRAGTADDSAAEKSGFLTSLFGSKPAVAATPRPVLDLADKPSAAAAPDKSDKAGKPLVKLASTGGKAGDTRPVFSGEALPGVRQGSLFEITRKSGLDDDSDIDLHEDEPSYRVASAAGLARLAPNGLLKQTDGVDVGCLKPSLVRMLKNVERHFGKKMIVTSGYRDPERNRAVRGARNSMHMYCAAADVQVPGVDKHRLAAYVRALPGRGGVGTYCHTASVHIDIGPERDWNWRCRAPRG